MRRETRKRRALEEKEFRKLEEKYMRNHTGVEENYNEKPLGNQAGNAQEAVR